MVMMNKYETWLEEYKHLQGLHNQKKHGYRGGASVPAGGSNAKYTNDGPKTSMQSASERAVSVGTNPPKAPPKGYHSGGTKVSQAAQATGASDMLNKREQDLFDSIETSKKKFGDDPEVAPLIRASWDMTEGRIAGRQSPKVAWKMAEIAAKNVGLTGKIDADPKKPKLPDWDKLKERVAGTFDIKNAEAKRDAANASAQKLRHQINRLKNATERSDIKNFDKLYADLKLKYLAAKNEASVLEGHIESYYEMAGMGDE